LTAFVATRKEYSEFDLQTFLSAVDVGRTVVVVQKNQTVFSQGDSSDAVFYVQKGSIRLSVLSKAGKEAIIAILNEGDFLGEGCLTGQALRMGYATAMTDSFMIRIDKKSMTAAIHGNRKFSDMFVANLLIRNIQYESNLVDHLFNSSEKRLARMLLVLAHFDKEKTHEVDIPRLSQETLAAMVGTTRGRVNFFMNKFRQLGLIDYRARHTLRIYTSLLTIFLYD